MEIKNRIVMTAMLTNFGLRNERGRAFYVERAKGKVGAIISTNILAELLDRDSFVEGVKKWVVDPIHDYETKIGVQIWYGNSYPSLRPREGEAEWVAPSSGVPFPLLSQARIMNQNEEELPRCRELTIAEIQDIIQRCAKAARREKETGFDFVEIHGAHGTCLAEQFFSPLTNHRRDKYGGDLKGKMRFSLELGEAVRAAVGEDFPVFWRLSAEEDWPGGLTITDNIALVKELAKIGIDVIDVSYGGEYCRDLATPTAPYSAQFTSDLPMGMFAKFAEQIRNNIPIPVMAVGRINRPEVAEAILSRGKADLIGMARQLIADPSWVYKVSEGREDDIRPCISCNNCVDVMMQNEPVQCMVNALAGLEAESQIVPADKAKRVVVVGGGPAGMEAARVAALRGHKVVLYERTRRLGGLLSLASLVHNGMEFITPYFRTQLRKTGVEVRLRQDINSALVEATQPDVIILATGAKRVIPEIPGIDKKNVLLPQNIQRMIHGELRWSDLKKCSIWQRLLWYTGSILLGFLEPATVRWLTKFWLPFQKRVVIVGGDLSGCQLADFLAKRGRTVTITETLPTPAAKMGVPTTQAILHRLARQGVTVLTGVKEYVEITDRGLVVVNASGKQQTIEGDTMVVLGQMKPNNDLSNIVQGTAARIHLAGDCVQPRMTLEAIHDGARAGREV